MSGPLPAPVWEDPPAPRQPATPWVATLAPVMDRPGCWARVGEWSATTTASAKRHQLQRGILRRPDGRWTFEARRVDGGSALWARFDGPTILPTVAEKAIVIREGQFT